MTDIQTLPYGSWPSPISIDLAVGSSRGLSEPRPDGDDIYVLESRPEEKGRVVLLRRTPDGELTDVAPGLNVRTRVHEYGGGAYAVTDGVIVLSEFDRQPPAAQGHAGGRAGGAGDRSGAAVRRHGLDIVRDRVYAAMEDQSESAIGARNLLVAVSLADGAITELATGHDFYSDPVLSPDGSRLAFLTWDFPQMPWDGTDLWVASIEADGTLGRARPRRGWHERIGPPAQVGAGWLAALRL